MKTQLTFGAPSDLSVGRIRIETAGQTVFEWIATPSEQTRSLPEVPAGAYTAFIEPLGQAPRAFFFEVQPGVANTVVSPALQVLAGQSPQSLESITFNVPDLQVAREPGRGGDPVALRLREAPPEAALAKALTIGLSKDLAAAAKGGWRPYIGPDPRVELTGGELHILVDRSGAPLHGTQGQRLRLSVAIEGTRVERMMVPLFAGGTRILLMASPLTTADIALRVIPVDAQRRALIQALQSGDQAEAAAVRDDVLRDGPISRFIRDDDQEDPWAAVTAALLAIRFPELFGPKGADWAPYLAARYPWMADVHVLLARHALTAAGGDPVSRLHAATAALASLHTSRNIGAPYFGYANQLVGELLSALGGAGLDKAFQGQVDAEMRSWRGDVPFQRAAGATFSWLMSDRRGHAAGEPASVYKATKGYLDERYSKVLFRGQVDLQQIGLLPPEKEAEITARWPRRTRSDDPQSPVPNRAAPAPHEYSRVAPGLSREISRPDDPHKNRFGGEASRAGYTLSANFEGTGRSWIGIVLKVTADPAVHAPSFTDPVDLFLHDSFEPSQLSATFQGHEASLKIFALGGFTVGAWLPVQQIELELDLALLPDAPQAIREF